MNLFNRVLLKLTFLFGKPLSDETYTTIVYRLKMGKRLNLKNPQTFNEKLQWLKLYDHNPLYTTLVDKYAVKDYVRNIIGEEYIIPTLGVWEKPEEIEWDKLPNQFVLKTTHGGGGDGVFICKDKESFDVSTVTKKLDKALKTNPYKRLREWPYKNVKPRIIAEQYMEDLATKESGLRDYKFYCFGGKPSLILVVQGRQIRETTHDYFDMDWQHQPLDDNGCHNNKIMPQKPVCFDDMKQIAMLLSQNLPQIRIDLYEVNHKVYFGEFTFVDGGGLNHFHPEKWNDILGSWITLPTHKSK